MVARFLRPSGADRSAALEDLGCQQVLRQTARRELWQGSVSVGISLGRASFDMFVRSVKDILGTDQDVAGNGWRSRRLILARDGLKYSVHETILEANVALRFAYASHRETVYCIEGEGSVRNLVTGETWELRPGSLYSVGIGDDHVVTTQSAMKLVCIFDPPLEGQEEAD